MKCFLLPTRFEQKDGESCAIRDQSTEVMVTIRPFVKQNAHTGSQNDPFRSAERKRSRAEPYILRDIPRKTATAWEERDERGELLHSPTLLTLPDGSGPNKPKTSIFMRWLLECQKSSLKHGVMMRLTPQKCALGVLIDWAPWANDRGLRSRSNSAQVAGFPPEDESFHIW